VSATASGWATASGVGVGVGVGVGDEPAVTANDRFSELVSPSASVTISFTYFVSATLNALLILQPEIVSQIVAPLWSSNDQTHEIGASPVDALPSSVTVCPVRTFDGAVQTAFAGVSAAAASESAYALTV
jgi:hypothetical protein